MTTPDYSTWLTKDQAAAALHCSTKTVEQFAKALRLPQARWRRPTGGPEIAVFDPEAVAVLVQERRQSPPTSLLPAMSAGNGNGNGHHTRSDGGQALAVTAATPAGDDTLRWFFDTLVTAIMAQGAPPTSEKSEKFFLTVAEAAAVSGLPQADLRRLIAAGELPVRQTGRGGVRIRRRDLEQF